MAWQFRQDWRVRAGSICIAMLAATVLAAAFPALQRTVFGSLLRSLKISPVPR